MATGEKPYRVYRGGRTKGRVPLERPQSRPDRNGRGPRPPKVRGPRRRWSWKKRIGVGLIVILLLTIVWAVAGYLSFRSGVEKANDRLGPAVPAALNKQSGLLLNKETTILMLGRDFANNDRRVGLNNTDSIMLLRTDPSRHRLAYLSIPRDLRVPIPGYGEDRVNSAFARGGAKLAIRTIRNFTGLDINHLMIVDFGSFKTLIDNIGGIEVNVREPILSNKFDCPYDAARCATWRGYRFEKGVQHMNGQRALIYARIRENQLNPGDNDITRGERQQAVLRATMSKLLGISTFFKLPFNGKDLLEPLTTDLSAWQFVQLGWVLKRANSGSTLHCRLGGTSASYGSDIIGSEDNIGVIAMVTGQSAPQPPRPGGGLFAPGCFVGNRNF